MTTEEQVLDCEKMLLSAMKNSDIITLDELIHDDLIFNIPTGQTITKEMDIQNYRSGIMTVEKIIPTDYLIKKVEDCVVVTVTIDLEITFDQQNVKGKFKYLRIWKNSNNSWKIIAGSGFQIQ